MMKLIHAFYNMDANSLELTYNDGSVLTIDCEEVENYYDITNGQMADLDWLLYNAPMEYASLALSGGSFLYFGQYSGYWNITISAYTFVRVFPL